MDLHKLGIAVLNYQTSDETIQFLESAYKFYGDLRIVVIDNGSSQENKEKLQNSLIKKNTSFLYLENNLGYANGLNAGVQQLRSEGYSFIACSNNDILFLDDSSLHVLTENLSDKSVAISGPRILTPKGRNQNPMLVDRPNHSRAKHMLNYYSYPNIVSRFLFNRFILNPIKKQIRKNKRIRNMATQFIKNNQYVYALNGAFFILGPHFFEYYNELDPHTFLYAEELILAEMVYKINLKMLYAPSAQLFHKEDQTSNMIWGGEDRLKPSFITRESMRHWYYHHYVKA